HEETLYVSTLRGVYALAPARGSLAGSRFRQLPGLARSCFEFLSMPGGLLAACEGGVFQISGHRARRLYSGPDAITLLRLRTDSSLVLVGLTDGLGLLRRSDAGWVFAGRIEDFHAFVRHTVEDDAGRIWIATRGPGLHRLHLDPDNLQHTVISSYGTREGLPEGRLRAFLLDGKLLVSSGTGLF